MTGAIVVDVGAAQLEDARAALARAVATGALGVGRAVRRDGDGCVFDGGRIDVTADGRLTWSLVTSTDVLTRVFEAVVAATVAGAGAAIGWAHPIYIAVPFGAVVGGLYAFFRISSERRRLRWQVRALVASLPVLLDARRQ